MKYITFGVLLIILASPSANAKQIITQDPGITPDNFLWGLDKAFDQISLLLTTGDANKAEKALEIAQERLLEIKAMIKKNKLDIAEKAKLEHGRLLLGVKQNIEKLREDDSKDEIKKVVEIEKMLEEHDQEVEQTFGELKIKIEVEGGTNQQQKELINSILDSLKEQTGEVEIKIENKKKEIKVKIKQETGKSEEEIESEIKSIEEKEGIEKDEKAFEAINESKKEFDRFLKKAKEKNVTISQDLINQFNSLLEESITQSEQGNFVEAKDLAKQAEELIDQEKREKKEFGEEKEIELETEEGKTKIEIKINGEKLKFEMDTTDLGEIISEISTRTGLSKDEINDIIKNKSENNQEKEVEQEIIENSEQEQEKGEGDNISENEEE